MQALLRINGGSLMQKEILQKLKENDDFEMYGKNKILGVLNNPNYIGKYWEIKQIGERNHIKEYHLIDIVQKQIDNIYKRL